MAVAVQAECTVYSGRAGDLVHFLEIPVQTLIVVVLPRPALAARVPRHDTKDLTAPGELVEREPSFELRVILEDEPDVVYRVQHLAGLGVNGKPVQPVIVRRLLAVCRLLNVCKISLHLCQTFRL